MSAGALLSPELSYIKEVLGVSSFVAPDAFFKPISRPTEPGIQKIQAKVLVWTGGKLSSSESELMDKILSSILLKDFYHLQESTVESVQWSNFECPWGLSFGESPQVKSSTQWVSLPSLKTMLDPQQSQGAKKKAWVLLKQYREKLV